MTEEFQSILGSGLQDRSVPSGPVARELTALDPVVQPGQASETRDSIVANVSYSSSFAQAWIGDARLAELDDRVLDLLPVGIYVCAPDATILRYNRRAVELWGRIPAIGDPSERFC